MNNFIKEVEYLGYRAKILYDVENAVFYGKLEDISNLISFEGKTEEDAQIDFENTVRDYMYYLDIKSGQQNVL